MQHVVQAQQFGYGYPGLLRGTFSKGAQETWAVHDLDLQLEAGERLLLVGASGSGKSTFAHALNGIVPQFYGGQVAGALTVCGLDPAEVPMSTLFRHVGMLRQDPAAQLFSSTVERELAFGLESLGLARTEIRARIQEIAVELGIVNLLQRTPSTLSGGEQQLVLLAAFIALKPRLLILDEPLSMLDAYARQRVIATLQASRVHAASAMSLLVIEHQLDEYIESVTTCALMSAGTIAARGVVASIFASLLEQPASGVAAPAPARWWQERIGLSVRSEQSRDAIPLSVDAAYRQLEQLSPALLQSSWARLHSSNVHQPAASHSDTQLVVTWDHVSYAYPDRLRGGWWSRRAQPQSSPSGALHEIDAVVQVGEAVAILGPNGAGKSTLLQTLNGLIRPQQGQVHVCGRPVARRATADLARVIGYVPQRPERLFFRSTVAEELVAGPQALGLVEETRAWRAQLIDMLQLGPLLERSPYTLSLGQQRLVGLAAVLAAQPRVIAFDEPTVWLDSNARAAFLSILKTFVNQGLTIIMATHDCDFAATVASRWLVLASGRLLADASPVQIMGDTQIMRAAALKPTATFLLDKALTQRKGQVCSQWSQE